MAEEYERLRERNEELEREVKEMRERERAIAAEMRQMWERLRVAEEAEERLCSQLADFEAESLQQARDYQTHILFLMQQISPEISN